MKKGINPLSRQVGTSPLIGRRNLGFTLVEILIVMTIVIMIAIIMIGAFVMINPVNKSRDSQRKKDLNRIKQAFEEYFNDKGYYPQDISNWNIKSNCHSNSINFSQYLSPWPCDPDGNPYMVIAETNKFRVMTNLENKEDDDIPKDWYIRTDILLTGITKNKVNYGVSSPNIVWYENYINPDCDTSSCLVGSVGGSCESRSGGCSGDNCFYVSIDSGDCLSKCQVSCCGDECL
ncbi:MAG: prepilin-type N-terminal cleavage/methylation domain-containing protein [Candidatus Shapirobacteria bacterium]|jgi:type II secretory pathway pseudopilin PulG